MRSHTQPISSGKLGRDISGERTSSSNRQRLAAAQAQRIIPSENEEIRDVAGTKNHSKVGRKLDHEH